MKKADKPSASAEFRFAQHTLTGKIDVAIYTKHSEVYSTLTYKQAVTLRDALTREIKRIDKHRRKAEKKGKQ